MAILPSHFLSSGVTSRLIKHENNLQIIKTKNCILSLAKYVSLKSDSYLNNIHLLNLETYTFPTQTIELSLACCAMYYVSKLYVK